MKAVIFDFDGVIIDSERYWDREMDTFGFQHVPGWKAGDNARLFTGRTRTGAYEVFCKEFGNIFTYAVFSAHMQEMQDHIHCENIQMLPGVQDLLMCLQKDGIPIGIGSSSSRTLIEKTLNTFSMRHFFTTISPGNEVKPAEGKPAPTIYLKVARDLNIAPEECLVIEDSQNGVRAAKAAKMTCIGLRNGCNHIQDLSEADHILEGFIQVTTETLRTIYHRHQISSVCS
ncbi:hypothetical protein COU77_02670 [Candidatus Peregrinibacteria bacterium CG10_big_fil_rev_8_21_14_0_10_49_16]|nr:MAG: hypothetical protein COW95_02180 [Candidatus Peregrinibacteria bacterium CG22_combo_CG10-13_8_21_14_all_49_11]PIR51944.1 MAG: hypothetical protein COU77_02670 [Candidatus Peregrinibacteria bacterium CG10_big_fil_rev_8_21_14_0_10_49_16]